MIGRLVLLANGCFMDVDDLLRYPDPQRAPVRVFRRRPRSTWYRGMTLLTVHG